MSNTRYTLLTGLLIVAFGGVLITLVSRDMGKLDPERSATMIKMAEIADLLRADGIVVSSDCETAYGDGKTVGQECRKWDHEAIERAANSSSILVGERSQRLRELDDRLKMIRNFKRLQWQKLLEPFLGAVLNVAFLAMLLRFVPVKILTRK